MSICATFDTNFDLSRPSVITPTISGDAPSIDTVTKKFGAGSIYAYKAPIITWRVDTNHPGNAGSIGYWTRGAGNFGPRVDMLNVLNYNIDAVVINMSYSTQVMELSMRDEAGVSVISESTIATTILLDTWHYIELNWLWNDGSGITELSMDGDVKYSTNIGNSYVRSPSGDFDYGLTMYLSGGDKWVDDLTYIDARRNVGNFTSPIAPNCTDLSKRSLTLGVPFGGIGRLGR